MNSLPWYDSALIVLAVSALAAGLLVVLLTFEVEAP